jgi:hypothetical protein
MRKRIHARMHARMHTDTRAAAHCSIAHRGTPIAQHAAAHTLWVFTIISRILTRGFGKQQQLRNHLFVFLVSCRSWVQMSCPPPPSPLIFRSTMPVSSETPGKQVLRALLLRSGFKTREGEFVDCLRLVAFHNANRTPNVLSISIYVHLYRSMYPSMYPYIYIYMVQSI